MQFVGLVVDFAVGSSKQRERVRERERERERDNGLSF